MDLILLHPEILVNSLTVVHISSTDLVITSIEALSYMVSQTAYLCRNYPLSYKNQGTRSPRIRQIQLSIKISTETVS